MEDRVKLPLQFDVTSLQKDLHSLEESTFEWIDHFVKRNYEGNWSVIPLRGPKGATHPVMMIYSDPNSDTFEDTPFLENCPYFQTVLNTFKCEVESSRLMKLTSGSVIKEHEDYQLGFEHGTIRLHIPIQTNDQVEFYLNNKLVPMKEGECWYLRLSDPHRVINNGPDRVHMVIDMKVNDWLLSLFQS